MRPQVILARHGRTPWHQGNRYTGATDVDVDEVGRQQADDLARWSAAAGLTALAATSLRRTQSTAAPIARATDLGIALLPELREIDFGVAEGKTISELRRERPADAEAFERDPVAHHWPAGDDPRARVAAALAALENWSADAGDRGMVVCHSTMIRLVVCEVLGIPLSEYRRRLPSLDPISITVLEPSIDRRWALVRYNLAPRGSADDR